MIMNRNFILFQEIDCMLRHAYAEYYENKICRLYSGYSFQYNVRLFYFLRWPHLHGKARHEP